MKICTECQFSVVDHFQSPQGWQQVALCTHPDCRDPVDGSRVPCNFARRDVNFCTIQGRYYKQKEVEIPKEPASVIELAK